MNSKKYYQMNVKPEKVSEVFHLPMDTTQEKLEMMNWTRSVSFVFYNFVVFSFRAWHDGRTDYVYAVYVVNRPEEFKNDLSITSVSRVHFVEISKYYFIDQGEAIRHAVARVGVLDVENEFYKC